MLPSVVALTITSSSLHAQQIELNAVTMDTVSGNQLGGFSQQGAMDQLFEAQKEMVFHILEQVGIPEESLPPGVRNEIAKKQTNSFAAFVAFSEGINQQDQGDFEAAEASFSRAAQLDPDFELATQALEALPEAEASMEQVAEKSQKEAEEKAEKESASEEEQAEEEAATAESEDEQLIAEAERGEGDGSTSTSTESLLAEVVTDSASSDVAQQQTTEDTLHSGYFDAALEAFHGGLYAADLQQSSDGGTTWHLELKTIFGAANLSAAAAEPPNSEANEVSINYDSTYYPNGGSRLESHVDSSHYLTGGAGFDVDVNGVAISGGTGSFTRSTPLQTISSSSGGGYFELGYYSDSQSSWISASNSSDQFRLLHNKFWYAEGVTSSGSALNSLAQNNARYSYSGVVGGVTVVDNSLNAPATIESCTSSCGTFSSVIDFGTHQLHDLKISANSSSYSASMNADNVPLASDGSFMYLPDVSGKSVGTVTASIDGNNTTDAGFIGAVGGEQAEVVGGLFGIHYESNVNTPSERRINMTGNFGGSR